MKTECLLKHVNLVSATQRYMSKTQTFSHSSMNDMQL